MESQIQNSNTTDVKIPSYGNMEWQMKYLFAISTVINPSIAVIGIGGNILSSIVLFQQGLEKSSFVLLFALSIADISYLVGTINIPSFIYTARTPYGFYYSKSVSHFLHTWRCVLNVLAYAGQCSALTLPVFITIERLVAVFHPFKLTQIFTSRRTAIAVLALFLFWSSYAVYIVCFFTLEPKYISHLNASIYVRNDDKLYTGAPVLINSVALHLQGSVPVSFVSIGCLIVGIKAKLIASRRGEMISGNLASSSRTTKMLLAVCVMYVIADGYGVIYPYVVQSRPDLQLILYAFAGLLLCLNSSWNFIIYVVMNKNLRTRVLALFISKRPYKGSGTEKTDSSGIHSCP